MSGIVPPLPCQPSPPPRALLVPSSMHHAHLTPHHRCGVSVDSLATDTSLSLTGLVLFFICMVVRSVLWCGVVYSGVQCAIVCCCCVLLLCVVVCASTPTFTLFLSPLPPPTPLLAAIR